MTTTTLPTYESVARIPIQLKRIRQYCLLGTRCQTCSSCVSGSKQKDSNLLVSLIFEDVYVANVSLYALLSRSDVCKGVVDRVTTLIRGAIKENGHVSYTNSVDQCIRICLFDVNSLISIVNDCSQCTCAFTTMWTALLFGYLRKYKVKKCCSKLDRYALRSSSSPLVCYHDLRVYKDDMRVLLGVAMMEFVYGEVSVTALINTLARYSITYDGVCVQHNNMDVRLLHLYRFICTLDDAMVHDCCHVLMHTITMDVNVDRLPSFRLLFCDIDCVLVRLVGLSGNWPCQRVRDSLTVLPSRGCDAVDSSSPMWCSRP